MNKRLQTWTWIVAMLAVHAPTWAKEASVGATLRGTPKNGACQYEVIENRFLNTFMGLGAAVDPIMGRFGLGFVVTAHGRPDDIKKIQEEADRWVKDHEELPARKDALVCNHCKSFVAWTTEGHVTREAFKFEHGVVAMANGETPEDVNNMLQQFRVEMQRKHAERMGNGNIPPPKR